MFCRKADEEDMILIFKFIEKCANSLNYWISGGSTIRDGLVLTDGSTRIKINRFFKLRNFKPVINDLLKQKYGDFGECIHETYYQQFTAFLLSFDGISQESEKPALNLAENASREPMIQTKQAYGRLKAFNQAVKREWQKIALKKASFFNVENSLNCIEENQKSLNYQKDVRLYHQSQLTATSVELDDSSRLESKSLTEATLGKRKRFDSKTRQILEDWYLENIENPYPR